MKMTLEEFFARDSKTRAEMRPKLQKIYDANPEVARIARELQHKIFGVVLPADSCIFAAALKCGVEVE
jgi:hypothetical protein